MPLLNKQKTKKYNYDDYLRFPEDFVGEIIDGDLYAMSPSPSRLHQEISMRLVNEIYNYLKGKSCKVYAAPFDVRLSYDYENNSKIKNVVQPDISVICDESKLDDKGANGAPDFIIEIVSPSSTFLDYVKKLNLYGEYGVKEYWIVNPIKKNVFVYRTEDTDKYGTPEIYNENDSIKVGIFEELTIDVKTIFF